MDGFRPVRSGDARPAGLRPVSRTAPTVPPASLADRRRVRVPKSVAELGKAVVAMEAPHPVPVKTAVPAKYMPPIDMDLPGEESPLRHLDSLLSHGRLANARRWAFRGAAMAMILVLVVGSFLLWQGFFNVNKSFGTPASLKTGDDGLLKGEADGRINILMLGRGGGNHDGPDLTDTMMINSIDVVNHTSTLISIPRDLWVDVPNQGAMKINSVFETGEFRYLGKQLPGTTNKNAIQAGFDEADQTVENVLGITIHYNVLLSFQAFKEAVDTVGGVDVKVPKTLVDPTMAWENHNNPVLAKAGKHDFNGRQALNYVRSRETSSDFARSQRQRAVLVALKSKITTLGTLSNPWKIIKLAKAFGNNIQTDLTLKNLKRLYGIVKNVPDNNTVSVGLADAPHNYITTGTLAGQSIALPKAGLFNYKHIQAFIRTQLKDPYLLKEGASITVLNGTPVSDMASAKGKLLKSYGYNIASVGNAPSDQFIQTQIIDLSHGRNEHTRKSLEQRFGITATDGLTDKSIRTNGADFVIILGSDEVPFSEN